MSFVFDRNYKNREQVEPFFAAYMAVVEELDAAGKYPYDDSFVGRIPGIEGADELTAIYMLQNLRALNALAAKVAEYLADGYEPIETLDATTKFAGIVEYGFYVGGTGWKEWHDARLVPRDHTKVPSAVLSKGKRTMGNPLSGGTVLVKR